MGEEIEFARWFIIHFTENNGMAYGMEFGGDYGKLFLSVFRIVFVAGMIWYLNKLVKEQASRLFIFIVSLVIAGAIGNIIDSVFYGMIFSSSDFGTIAQMFPAEGGYSSFLHGKVVDMFYFPIYRGILPNWIPIYGGKYFEFFQFIFNVADACITIGVFIILIFQKQFFKDLNAANTNPTKEISTP